MKTFPVLCLLCLVACDGSSGGTDNSPPPGVDANDWDPGKIPPGCEGKPAPTLEIAQECASDCDCKTGFCYDEPYTAPHKVCTQVCLGAAGCPSTEAYKCLVFTSELKYAKGLTTMSLCMPTCKTAADCQVWGDFYTYCGDEGMTYWGDTVVGGRPTCQVQKM